MKLKDRDILSVRQVTLTVTGPNWTTTRAVGIPYRTLNGVFRLRFNISGGLAPGAASFFGTIKNVKFKSGVNQAIAVAHNAVSNLQSGAVQTGSGNFNIIFSATVGAIDLSGDVELEEEPFK